MVLNITVSNYNTLFVSIVMKKDQVNRLTLEFFNFTRSYAALRAADLDWIVRPGYILGGYNLEKNMKNQPGTMKNHLKPTQNHEKPS